MGDYISICPQVVPLDRSGVRRVTRNPYGWSFASKARRVTIYAPGARAYREHCEEVARAGYPGLRMA